ncbi:hypothetical protein ACCS79_03590 [Rhizobium johnstonii]|uniref:glycine-rich domain-containing protein n=1 Tax=Rhizobium johnstonii TaxID=3019933 RepID=UPI003F95A0BF
MTFVSVPFPRIVGGSSSGPIRVRKRALAPVLEITESGDLTRQAVLDHIAAHSPGYLPEEILVECILVGGGGHGGNNIDLSTGVYGGLPGQVRRFDGSMSDLWHTADDHLVVDIGAGGGGSSTVLFHFHEEANWLNAITAAGGSGYAADADYYLVNYLIARAQAGYLGPDLSALRDRADILPPGFSLIYGNPDGPGAGGAIYDQAGSTVLLFGAPSSTAKSELSMSGGYQNGMAGENAPPGSFEIFGGGGAPGIVDETNPNGDGGDGAYPGGGGGPTNSSTGNPGQGAQGVLRLRLSVWEKVT